MTRAKPLTDRSKLQGNSEMGMVEKGTQENTGEKSLINMKKTAEVVKASKVA